MGGLLMLIASGVIMALASFLAGALPLSMTLTQSQLRLISSVGIGILVGTSLIVIIPEGVGAVAAAGGSAHAHSTRHPELPPVVARWNSRISTEVSPAEEILSIARGGPRPALSKRSIELPSVLTNIPARDEVKQPAGDHHEDDAHAGPAIPTFFIGLSLTAGFILMFLIDRLPRHATDKLQAAPATRHISLDNLEETRLAEEESDGFLGSMAPTPKQSRSLATTTGLVIHSAADGIAMGASATTSDTKLGFVIFIAIMVHKAPAAFGLTSLLLKQGLSKRAARGHLIVFSLAAPAGALGTFLLISLLGGGSLEGDSGKWWTGMLLLFSAGTFLYVAMHAMQEDSASPGHDHHGGANGFGDPSIQKQQTHPRMRETLATVGGMLLPLLTQFGHHH